jgi:hypothetical protein
MPWMGAAVGAVGSIAGGLLGKSSAPKTSKWYRDNVKSLYGQAQTIANRPFEEYTDPRFADFSQDQLGAMDMVRGNLGLGSGAVSQAIGGAQNAMGYNPLQVGAGSVSAQNVSAPMLGVNYNPNSISAQMVGGGYNYTPQQVSGGGVSAQQIKDKSFLDYNIQDYMNPYTQQVIDTSLGDIERARLETENAQKADMLAAGAWGGSRSGVAQSLTNREFGNTAASTAATLRNQGFNTASNLISQDANRNLQAGMSNQAAALAAAQSNASLGLQAQLANQAAGMGNAQFGANFGLQQGLANQSADMQAQMANLQSQQFGANLGLNAGMANQGAAMQASLANQSAGLQAGMYNSDAALRAGMANQSAGLTGNAQQMAGAQLLAGLGGQQQNMAAMDSQNMMNIGNMQQQQAQQPMDFAYQQFLMGQGWDQDQMNFLKSFLSDPKGVVQAQPNQGLGILGGALTGANLANSIYGAYQQSQPVRGYSGINPANYPVPSAPIPQDFSWLKGP